MGIAVSGIGLPPALLSGFEETGPRRWWGWARGDRSRENSSVLGVPKKESWGSSSEETTAQPVLVRAQPWLGVLRGVQNVLKAHSAAPVETSSSVLDVLG